MKPAKKDPTIWVGSGLQMKQMTQDRIIQTHIQGAAKKVVP